MPKEEYDDLWDAWNRKAKHRPWKTKPLMDKLVDIGSVLAVVLMFASMFRGLFLR